jgi:hypothetical protein
MFGYVLAGGVRRGAASYVEVWLVLAGKARHGTVRYDRVGRVTVWQVW